MKKVIAFVLVIAAICALAACTVGKEGSAQLVTQEATVVATPTTQAATTVVSSVIVPTTELITVETTDEMLESGDEGTTTAVTTRPTTTTTTTTKKTTTTTKLTTTSKPTTTTVTTTSWTPTTTTKAPYTELEPVDEGLVISPNTTPTEGEVKLQIWDFSQWYPKKGQDDLTGAFTVYCYVLNGLDVGINRVYINLKFYNADGVIAEGRFFIPEEWGVIGANDYKQCWLGFYHLNTTQYGIDWEADPTIRVEYKIKYMTVE